MKLEKCPFCKGTRRESHTEFIARVDNEIVVIRDIPAYVCERCHEAYFTPDISRIMDTIIEEAREGSLCMKPLAVSKVSM
ncbi:hypothetical protein DSECCO2_136410 [anaerobic digester metagenome]